MLTLRSGQSISESPQGGPHIEQDPDDRQAWFRSMWEGKPQPEPPQLDGTSNDADDDDDDDGFGDDFDEFAEEGGDEDFGDFDEPTPAPPVQPPSSAPF